MILETAAALLTSSGFGAITGLIGGWLTKREDFKAKQLDYSHEEKMGVLRKEELALEQAQELAIADKQVERAEVEGELTVEAIEAEAFKDAIDNATKPVAGTLGAVGGFIKSAVRIVITVYLAYVTTQLLEDMGKIVGGLEGLPVADVVDLYKLVINTILFLTVMAVSWWYSARPSAKVEQRFLG